jgi:uncharacterized protein
MTPQERDLITALLARLHEHAGQARDPEADALIRSAMAQQPDAPYFLVQTVLIQDMALNQAQSRIHELEAQLAARPAAQSTSFLGGRGSVPSAGAPPRAAASPVWTQSGAAAAPPAAAPSLMPGGGSSFLQQAAMTAAGVAGGALLFQGIQSLFGSHFGGGMSGFGAQPGLSETVINNYYGSDDAAAAADADDTQSGSDFADSDSGDLGGDDTSYDS